MLVKVFMFFFLLSSCYLFVFLSSLSALMQACRHLIPMFFSLIYHTHRSSIHLSLQVVIPISSLKLAGIRHPPLHPFFSHSFSIPLPHLHGVSRVHAILHSFAYPLKPLTQAFTSIQPTKPVFLSKLSPTCGILSKKCHVAFTPLRCVAWLIPPGQESSLILLGWESSLIPLGRESSLIPPGRESSLIAPGRESSLIPPGQKFSLIPPGYLTSEIFPRRHSIRMFHTRNSSPPPFHPDVSHPEFFSAAIPSGCLAPEILLHRHSIRMSHVRNPSLPTFHPDISHPESCPPTFNLPRISRIRNSVRPTFRLFLHPQSIFLRFPRSHFQ